MFQSQSAPNATTDEPSRRRATRVSSCGRTKATTATSTTSTPAGVERERRAEVSVHRGDARARHAAQRARDARDRAQRARDRRMYRQQRPHRAPTPTQPGARDARRSRSGRELRPRRPCSRCHDTPRRQVRPCLATTMPSSTYSGWLFGGMPATFGASGSRGRARSTCGPARRRSSRRSRNCRTAWTSPGSIADTSHVATAVGGDGDRCRRVREPGEAIAGDDRARPRDRRAAGRARSRRSRSCRPGRRPGRKSMMRAMLRTALARKRTGSPCRPTHSDARGLLADRAAVVERLERDVVGEHVRKMSTSHDRHEPAGCAEGAPTPSGERDDERHPGSPCRGGGREIVSRVRRAPARARHLRVSRT